MATVTKLPTAAAQPVEQATDNRSFLEKFQADDLAPLDDLDWSQVTRLVMNAEPTLQDAVEFTPRAALQARSLFWRRGLRRTPATWGELVGNWNYCRLLDMWLMGLEGESEAMQGGLLAKHDERYPGLGELLRRLAAKDLEGAHAWHEADSTFARNASDPMLTKDPEAPSAD